MDHKFRSNSSSSAFSNLFLISENFAFVPEHPLISIIYNFSHVKTTWKKRELMLSTQKILNIPTNPRKKWNCFFHNNTYIDTNLIPSSTL